MKKRRKHHHHHHGHAQESTQPPWRRLNRRDFLVGTAALGLGGLALSPLARLLQRAEVSAQLANCGGGKGPIPRNQVRAIVNLPFKGGVAFPTFVAPRDQSGGLWDSSKDGSLLGLGPKGTARIIEEVGVPGRTHPLYAKVGNVDTGFYQGLMGFLGVDQSDIHFLFIHGDTHSDSIDIPLCTLDAQNLQLKHMGNNAPLFENGIASNPIAGRRGLTYEPTVDLQRDLGENNRLLATVVGDVIGIQAAGLPPGAFNSLPPEVKASFLNALGALSNEQIFHFLADKELAGIVSEIYSCSIEKAGNVDASLASQLDVRKNPSFVNYMKAHGLDITTLADDDPLLFSIMSVAVQAQGLSLAVNNQIFESNFDYHFGGDVPGVQAANRMAGEHMGAMIVTAKFFQTPTVFICPTDGGCATNDGRFGALELWTDDDNKSGILLVAVNPVRPPVRTSLGHYNTNHQGAEISGTLSWAADEKKLGTIALLNAFRLFGVNDGDFHPPLLQFMQRQLGDLNKFDLTRSG